MKMYNFNIKGVVSQQDMEDFILEVNNCEFCNNGTFNLYLKEFSYNEEEDMGIGIIEVSYNGKVNIDEKLGEMINCEFCHNEIDYICVTFIETKEELKPKCYVPNNDTYPLCKGNINNKEQCNHCALYENMIEPYDYV